MKALTGRYARERSGLAELGPLLPVVGVQDGASLAGNDSSPVAEMMSSRSRCGNVARRRARRTRRSSAADAAHHARPVPASAIRNPAEERRRKP